MEAGEIAQWGSLDVRRGTVEMDDQPSSSGTDLASSAMSGKDVSVSRTRESETGEGTWVQMKPKKKKRTESQ